MSVHLSLVESCLLCRFLGRHRAGRRRPQPKLGHPWVKETFQKGGWVQGQKPPVFLRATHITLCGRPSRCWALRGWGDWAGHWNCHPTGQGSAGGRDRAGHSGGVGRQRRLPGGGCVGPPCKMKEASKEGEGFQAAGTAAQGWQGEGAEACKETLLCRFKGSGACAGT